MLHNKQCIILKKSGGTKTGFRSMNDFVNIGEKQRFIFHNQRKKKP